MPAPSRARSRPPAAPRQLTGDKAHAEKAKEILGSMLGLAGSQDIHYGPIAQSMAVTLDLCYDAWDAEFRQAVIDNLARRMMNLETLTGMGGASLNPWHNHEAIRACGAGVAAVCLLGEKTRDGKEIPGLERIVHVNARSIRRFFQTNGNSNTGWGMEGAFYKRMTWNSGPGNMIQAYRTALGGDMMAGWPGAWCMLGELGLSRRLRADELPVRRREDRMASVNADPQEAGAADRFDVDRAAARA